MFTADLPSPVQPIPRVANNDPLWKEPVWIRNAIIAAFRQPSQGDNKTCVVLFMSIEDARDSVAWPANFQGHSPVCHLHLLYSKGYVRESDCPNVKR